MKSRGLVALTAGALLLSGCGGVAGGSITGSDDAYHSCSDVLATVVHRVRTGDTAGAVNAELDWLTSNCSAESETWADYMSARSYATQFGLDTCGSWTERIGKRAIDLLSEENLCSDDPAGLAPEVPRAESQLGGGVPWHEASQYVGTTQYVCGPLADIGASDDDVFLNIGRAYPDPERFTIVLWDIGGVEPIPPGVTLCVSGDVTLYEGVAQIQVRSASAVEIYE